MDVINKEKKLYSNYWARLLGTSCPDLKNNQRLGWSRVQVTESEGV